MIVSDTFDSLDASFADNLDWRFAKMYTVLLTDDESTVLDTLTTQIHWQQLGVSTVLTASDGNQALEIMSSQKVDLLITDIQMPHMDGLTLLHEVRTFYPDTHCVLLTAYGEFEYARQAMQLGVENYLLKPLQMEELEETIEKALDNIYASRTITKELFRNNILLRWANGTISDEELSERASLINVNLYLPEYCVVIFSKKQSSISLSNYCHACAAHLFPDYEVHHFRDERHRHLAIVGGSRINPTQLLNCFTAEAAKRNLSSHIVLAIGNTVQSTANLAESFQSACNLIESVDTSLPEMIILTQAQDSDPEENKLVQELNTIFHQQEEENRYHEFHQVTAKLYQMTADTSVSKVTTLLTHSLSRLFSQEFSNRPDAQEQLYSRMRLFMPEADSEAFTASIIELLEYSYLLFTYYFEQHSPIIQSAITYVHKHYAESISIKEFCDKNKMSTAYLGYLFKKETGMFFNNYLLQYRICCSIRLLLDTEQKINDIAQNVGFSSTNYYISCFKKQTGLSPNKYRTRQP